MVFQGFLNDTVEGKDVDGEGLDLLVLHRELDRPAPGVWAFIGD